MISMLQQIMPTSAIRVRPLLRIRLRTIILALKEKCRHRAGIRSNRIRLPDFGGLGRSRLAVVSRAALLYAWRQMITLKPMLSAIMPQVSQEIGARS